jgi:importin subunit beta-1
LALGEILPVLLDLLTQQSEDDDEDDWTRAMAAAACLELLARNIGDEIVQPVVPYVEAGIRRNEWQHREAAVMAFGSILDGPEPTTLEPLVDQAIGALINMLQSDPSMPVRDTVAWTLSKITEVMLDNVKLGMHIQNLVSALVAALQGPPRIANSCCSALGNLAAAQPENAPAPEDAETSNMSSFYPGVLAALVTLSDKPTNESNSRSAAYSTISTLVTCAAKDTLPLVQEVIATMLARQEHLMTYQNQLVGSDDRQNWNDIQISICSVLTSTIHRAPEQIRPFADRIMTNLLGLISSSGKHSSVLEDAFFTIGALASALENDFVKYMDAFAPYLLSALTSFEDWQVAQAAVYVTSDAARAINEALIPYAERIMVSLVELLRSPVVNRAVKPNAITTIGEVAMAIGSAFVPYLDTTMGILSQAGSTSAVANDYAMIEFVWTMREAIVDAFIGIMNGLKVGDRKFSFDMTLTERTSC